MKKIVLLAMSAFMSIASMAQGKVTKTLVLYYSQTGMTKYVAEEIQKNLGADIQSIELDKPYDGDFQQTIARCQQERQNGPLPTLKPFMVDVKKYDTIYLGYPIWFGTYAPPVEALIKQEDFAGKTIVPFCTFGSGGLEESTRDLKKNLPKANVADKGYGVRTARKNAVQAELKAFFSGAKEAAYSEQKPVTEEEKKIFNDACGDYQFPLGTPETVGKRITKDGTDYKYTVKSRGMDGKEGTSIILVTLSNKQGTKAEFTRVIR